VSPSVADLKRLLDLREKIEALEAELEATLRGAAGSSKQKVSGRGKAKLSPAARERMAAAQRARWAKVKTSKEERTSYAKGAKRSGRRKLSPEARERIGAAHRGGKAAAHKAKVSIDGPKPPKKN